MKMSNIFNKKLENLTKTEPSNISLMGAVFLIFMTLKLTGYIDWSWWWVTAPLWGTFFFVFVFCLIVEFVRK